MITITVTLEEVADSGGSVRCQFQSPPAPNATAPEKALGFKIIEAIRQINLQNGGVELGGN